MVFAVVNGYVFMLNTITLYFVVIPDCFSFSACVCDEEHYLFN